jgi:hypothetical protein
LSSAKLPADDAILGRVFDILRDLMYRRFSTEFRVKTKTVKEGRMSNCSFCDKDKDKESLLKSTNRWGFYDEKRFFLIYLNSVTICHECVEAGSKVQSSEDGGGGMRIVDVQAEDLNAEECHCLFCGGKYDEQARRLIAGADLMLSLELRSARRKEQQEFRFNIGPAMICSECVAACKKEIELSETRKLIMRAIKVLHVKSARLSSQQSLV